MDYSRQIIARSKLDTHSELVCIPGHYLTSSSHVTNYLDITALKSRCSEAKEAAKALAKLYQIDTPVDSIVCLDGTNVIGTYLAEELTKVGILSYNAHKSLYVVSPEYTNGKLIFRDNLQLAIAGKNILILSGSATTGITLQSAMNTIYYYKGRVSGVAALFSAVNDINGIPVQALFRPEDIPNYESYKPGDCPLCKNGTPIDALVNSFGYSEL